MEKFHRSPVQDYAQVARAAGKKDFVVEQSDRPYKDMNLVELRCNDIAFCVVGKYLRFYNNGSYESYEKLYNAMEKYELVDKIDYIELVTRFDIYFSFDERIEVYIGESDDADMKIRFFKGILSKLDDDAEGTLDLTSTKEASFKPKDPDKTITSSNKILVFL